MTTTPDALYSIHLGVMILNGAAPFLLGLLLWLASITNYDPFTKRLLKVLAVAYWGHSLAIVAQMYRAGRILAEDVPVDGALIGLLGRVLEVAFYCVPIWIMLKPETQKRLNGGNKVVDKRTET